MHRPARQQAPAVQDDPLQQGWPAAPQLTQVYEPPEHSTFGAVQEPSGQQGSPRAPQVPHAPP